MSRPREDITPFTRVLSALVMSQDWMSSKQLAEQCEVSPKYVNTVLAELECEGLTKRQEDHFVDDEGARRRFYWHAATVAGRREHNARVARIRKWVSTGAGHAPQEGPTP